MISYFLLVVEKQESTTYMVSEQLSSSVIYDLLALSRSLDNKTLTGAHQVPGPNHGPATVMMLRVSEEVLNSACRLFSCCSDHS